MAKQYIPGVSGLLTEPNPVDAPSNTLTEAENVIVEQGGKVQARHGLNINETTAYGGYPKNTNPNVYLSQFVSTSPFIKILEFKTSNDDVKDILFVKQIENAYAYNNTGIYKTSNTTIKNAYYKFDSSGNIGGIGGYITTFPYNTVKNVFNTRDTLYVQTENGLADANIDDIDVYLGTQDKFFTNKWPAFPEISYKLKKSELYSGWLDAGMQCGVQITFYREMGYTDKQGVVYESEPSVPIVVESLLDNVIPEFYIDFRIDDNTSQSYKKYLEFTKTNRGRKFGIRIYRTKSVPLYENLPTEYYQCFPDLPFEKFMASRIYEADLYYSGSEAYCKLSDYLSSSDQQELNIGDIISIGFDSTQLSQSGPHTTDSNFPFKIVQTDLPIKNPFTGTVSIVNNNILVPDNTFQVGDIVTFDSTYSLPLALEYETPYYIIDVTTSGSSVYIKISLSPNGSEIDFTDTGTGTLLIYSTKFMDSGLDYPQLSEPPYRTLPSISNPNPNNPRYPAKHKTTDSSLLKYDFRPARLEVIAKKLINPGPFQYYVYQFKTLDNIYNLRLLYEYSSTPSAGFIQANTIINNLTLFRKLVAVYPYTGYLNNFLALRSYIVPLELNDDGIIGNPQLYTTSNMDGAEHTNIIVPRANNAIKYKDFYVYHGIQKTLNATVFVASQPIVEQIYFHNIRHNVTESPWITVYPLTSKQPPSNLFFLPSQNSKLPIVGSTNDYLTSQGGRLYLDAPFCGVQDAQVKTFNSSGTTVGLSKKNTLTVDSNVIINPIISPPFNETTITDQNRLSTYKFVATAYEEAKLTLRLTSISNITTTVSIKAYPFYNRRGYYKKYNTKGFFDNKALEFDFSIYESNGIQLTNNQEFSMYQFANTGKPSITVNANNPMYGKDTHLPEAMGHGIFNVIGRKGGQYPSDGQVKGFTVTEATNSRGLFWDKTNGKIVIRTDGTFGASTNRFDLKKFESPGYLLLQYRKSVDGNKFTGEWNSNATCIYSYSNITQRSNGIYDIIGAKPVSSSLSVLEGLTSLHSDVIIDLFYIKAASVDQILLYPYSDAPVVRKTFIYITASTYDPSTAVFGAVLMSYCPATAIVNGGPQFTWDDIISPIEPIFTFHPHINKSKEPIAVFSSKGNHQFLGVSQGYGKSEAELLDEYTFSIINAFNKELRAQGINATLRKGLKLGEISIDYPDGKKIEMKNDYGGHQFYPSLDVGEDNYIVLSERVNNEYEEKNLIQWSRREIPEITTGLLYARIGRNDKSIIGAAANVDDLYVFKEDGIWRCSDKGNFNPPPRSDLPVVSNYLFSNTFICQAEGSIQEINDEIIFLSQYGFASIVNGGIINISGAIERDILTLISTSPKDRIRSFVNKSKNLYYCTLINESDSTLDVKSGTYVFNTKTRQWSFINEEVLAGLEDYQGKNIVAYRQKLTKAKLLSRVSTARGTKPTFEFTSDIMDSYGRLQQATETIPLDLFYVSKEQHTNNIRINAVDQYDFKTWTRTGIYIEKTGINEFRFKMDTITDTNEIRYRFSQSIESALVTSAGDNPAEGSTVSVVDSFISMLINRTLYLTRSSSIEMHQIKIKKTVYAIVNAYNTEMFVYYEFFDTPPSWFSNLSIGAVFPSGSTYSVVAGIPVKITFNPESGNAPDTNKLFQEYMIHTETSNKGALMAFKTDSRTTFSSDRRFVYDAASTSRNVFRTYIPTQSARGRYLIRQIKHDVPLENLIITGQTIVMKDSGSTRVQKDKDNG